MNLKDTPKSFANEVIELHKQKGLNQIEAEKAALVSIQLVLSIGVLPGYESKVQKVENYLKKDLIK